MRQRENLQTLYILLFLNIAFFFLQMQDPERYFSLFAFDQGRIFDGEIWRIFTYQFVQGRSFIGGPAISLFFTLLILYIMGSPLEEEWGSFNFILFFIISTLGSAAAAIFFNLPPLLGSYAFSYSLLFAYATNYPQQSFMIFFVLPVRVTWLAYLSLGFLVIGLLGRRPDSIAAAAGALASYGFFLLISGRHRTMRVPRKRWTPPPPPTRPEPTGNQSSEKNLERFAEMKRTVAEGSAAEVDALAERISQDIVPGVNICPPADYKPEHQDRYCVGCDGFAECSVRYLKANRPLEREETVGQS
jgi:membrane associated rhomboid family serine protease